MLVDIFEIGRVNSHPCHGAEEISVRPPPGNDVNVQVVGNSCTARFADVDADVHAVGGEDLGEEVGHLLDEIPEVGQFLIAEAVQIGHGLIRDHHEMSQIVGEAIEQTETAFRPGENEVGIVIT